MKFRNLFASASLTLALGAWTAMPANAASLLSGTVSVTNNGPTLSDIVLGPVSGPTTEGIDLGNFLFSFTANSVTYTDGYDGAYNTVPQSGFNGFVLTFTGAPKITSVSLDPSSQQTPVLTFDANQILLDFNGGVQVVGQTVTVDVSTSAVPEPATWAVMLVGFGGLGAAMRVTRRRRIAATA